MPTVHDLPPPREADLTALAAFRDGAFKLTCVASLARLPQISIPVTTINGCPAGLSFIGGIHNDERLLYLAEQWSRTLSG